MVELTPKQQVIEMLRNQKRFLLLTHKNVDGDAIGSMIALYNVLTKMGKEVIAYSGDTIPAVFNYLPSLESVTKDFNGKRSFVISLDTTAAKADKIMYKVEDNKLDIIITPKDGIFEEKVISFPKGSFNFDAIIVLDSTDLERLGSVYEEYPEIFYEVPVINIDHHAGNDHFGKINLVDLTATSTAEILVSVVESLTGDPKSFDEKIATALLTGIITDTNSFQNTNTTPKCLTVSAQLVAAGGNQQEIIKNIYKTKPLSTLRLWGRALSNLHDELEYKFVWSEIYKKDYLEVGAVEEESSGLIDELLKTAAGMDFALLLSEKNGDVHGSLRSTGRTKDVSVIAKLFNGGGHPMAAAFQLNGTNLLESSGMIIEKIKNLQSQQSDAANKSADQTQY